MNTQDNPYRSQITRKHPSAFVFLLDISGSMEEKVTIGGEPVSKSQAVADIVNGTLAELVNRCKREDGYREYLDIAVIGYGGDGVTSLLPEGGSHPVFRKPHELALANVETVRSYRERKLPSGRTSLSSVETRQWIKPGAIGNTPMYKAFTECYKLLADWTKRHKNMPCFPPMAIHITDGEATDAEEKDIEAVCEKIRGLTTANGNTLLMNIFLGKEEGEANHLFPSSSEQLPESRYARMLYRISSVMPEIYHEEIKELTGSPESGPRRGMSYNCSLSDLIGMLRIGSLSVTLLA